MEHIQGARTLAAYCRPDHLLPIDDQELEVSVGTLGLHQVDQEVVHGIGRLELGVDGNVLRIEQIDDRHGAPGVGVRDQLEVLAGGGGRFFGQLDTQNTFGVDRPHHGELH